MFLPEMKYNIDEKDTVRVNDVEHIPSVYGDNMMQ